MSRRLFVAGLASVAAAGTAGCSDSNGRGPAVPTAPPRATDGSPASTAPAAATTAATAGPASGYFPPASGEWDTVEPVVAGFDADRLARVVELVERANSQSLVILHDGRIVAEQYWMGATAETTHDLASCQKSVSSTLVGLARDRGLLELDDPVSQYLPAGWTRASAAEEGAITIRHLLTMSSGLDERTLKSTAEPGTVWEYNTAAYQKLRRVLEAAAGTDINSLSSEWLFDPIGIDNPTAWADRPGGSADPAGDHQWGLNLTAREMARFGLLAMRNGEWNGEQITDPGWFAEAWTPTSLKRDYGYLWWLLGRGHLAKRGAPADMVAALGAQDQKIYVAPGQGLVLTRQGKAANNLAAAESDFDTALVTALVEARA